MGSVNVRGQGSTEFLLLFAAAVVFFGILYAVTLGSSNTLNSRNVEVSANLAANDLANAAKDVHAQGAGARKMVSVTLPESYDPEASRIEQNAIIIHAADTDYVRTLDFSLQGTLPNASGTYSLPVENNGASVVFGTAVSGVNKTYLSSLVAPGANYSESLLVSSYSLDELNGTVSAVWDDGSANLTFAPTSFSLSPFSTQQINVSVNTSALSKGTYTGKLLVMLEGNGTNGNQSFQIPIVIVVSSAPLAQVFVLIAFVSPTPEDGAVISGPFTLNTTIHAPTVEVTLNWNGINYTQLDGNLVLMLNLNNNPGVGDSAADAADSSTYANNGTINGANWVPGGKYGSALYFDGSADKVTVPNSPYLNPDGGITLEAWADAGDSRQITLLSKGSYSLSIGPDDVPYFELDAGGEGFTDTGTAQDVYVSGFATVNGSLYATGYGNGTVSRYDGGTTWTGVGYPAGAAYAIISFNKTIFVGDYNGTVYRYDGGTSWTSLGSAGGTVYGLIGYGDSLYAGLYDPQGTVMRYDGGTTWTSAGSLHPT